MSIAICIYLRKFGWPALLFSFVLLNPGCGNTDTNGPKIRYAVIQGTTFNQNKNPIPNATVQVNFENSDAVTGATTDNNGQYELPVQLRKDTTQIRIRFGEEYFKVDTLYRKISPGDTLEVNYQFELK